MLLLLKIRILQQMITALTDGCHRGEFYSKYHQMRDMMVALPLIAMALLLIINNTQCTRRDERMATVKSSSAPDQDQPEPGERDSAMVQQLVQHSPMHTAILRFIRVCRCTWLSVKYVQVCEQVQLKTQNWPCRPKCGDWRCIANDHHVRLISCFSG